jgi:hypothetical protein
MPFQDRRKTFHNPLTTNTSSGTCSGRILHRAVRRRHALAQPNPHTRINRHAPGATALAAFCLLSIGNSSGAKSKHTKSSV